VYELEISTSDYILTLGRGRRYVPIGYIKSHLVVSRNAGGWSAFATGWYSVALRDPAAPYVKLRLIDTPALSGEYDCNYSLDMSSEASDAYARRDHLIDAVALMHSAKKSVSFACQQRLRLYQRNLQFCNLTVVNSFSNPEELIQRGSIIYEKESTHDEEGQPREPTHREVLDQLRGDRTSHFKLLFGPFMSTAQFFVDRNPKAEFAYIELLSRNTVCNILASWVASWKKGNQQSPNGEPSDEMEE